MFVVGAAHNYMSYEDCMAFVTFERESELEFNMIQYTEEYILFEGKYYLGYKAPVEISKDGFTQNVDVEFIFFEQIGEVSIVFPNGFFGPLYEENLRFITEPTQGLNAVVSEFYDTLLDDQVNVEDFCNIYYLVSPIYDYELNNCINYVNFLRSLDLTYTIGTITPVFIDDVFNGRLIGFEMNLVFDDGSDTENLIIDFGIMDSDGHTIPFFFDHTLVDLPYEQEVMFINFTSRYIETLINEFYDTVTDTTIGNTEFCSLYVTTGGVDNAPLSSLECGTIRTNLLKNSYTFTVNSYVYYEPGHVELSPHFQVNVTRNTFPTYTMEFYTYYDPLGNLMIRVNLDDALGGGFE